jgi:hypothetical protein
VRAREGAIHSDSEDLGAVMKITAYGKGVTRGAAVRQVLVSEPSRLPSPRVNTMAFVLANHSHMCYRDRVPRLKVPARS